MESLLRRRTPLAKLSWGVVVAAVIAAPLAATHTAAAADGDTTVLSSTFDDGTIAPWTGNGGATLSVVADPDGTGKSLEATGITAGYAGPAVDLTKLLTVGTAYTVSFEARLADASQPADSVHFTVDDGNYTWIASPTAINADGWTKITGSYTLSASATKANMYLDSTVASGAAYPDVLIDNVTITGPASGGTGGGTTCTPSDAKSLVSADFDDQKLDGLQQDGNPTLSYENVSGDAASDYALRVSNRTQNYDGVQTAPGAFSSLKAGDTVNVSAKVRLATTTDATLQARIVAVGSYSWIGNQSTITDGAWTTLSGSYTVASGDDPSTLKFYIGTGDSTNGALSDGTTTFDYDVNDFSIEVPAVDCGGTGGSGSDCTYPTSDTVISSDFESGDADGWVARSDANGSATVAVTDTQAHGGTHSIEASDRTDQGQGIGHDVTCLLQPGQTYEFSGWVRFGAGQPTDGVWLSLANTVGGSTTYTTLGQFTNVTNSGWAQIDQKFTMPASSDSALLYVETKYYSDGSAGNVSDLYFDDLTVTKPAALTVQDLTPIKDTLPFPVGAAVSDPEITGAPGQLLVKHFDQVTPENSMKPESWYDANGNFVATNADADQLMTFAQQNKLRVYGHNLVWYQQTPDWFFNVSPTDSTPLTNSDADKQILRDRLDTHIKDVAQYLSSKFGAFGSSTNPLVSFDVVNEAVSDNVGDPNDLRQSRWYQVLGPEYIEDAFNDANKYFDEDAANGGFAADGVDHPIALFYNDYNTEQAGKRSRVVELIKNLIADGVPVDGIGHQFHVTMSTPLSTLKDAIDAFNGITTARGKPLEQAVTELDVPTGTPVTTANQIDQGYYYQGVFDMLRSEAASGASIFSATVWGLTDSQSWRASSGAPLLFDDDLQAKPAYYGVTDQPLPAKQLSAIVFQESPTDAWDQLPLHPIAQDGSSGFQLRWASDHLTAYVSVTDGSTDASDQATFAWGDGSQTVTVKRDGTVSDDSVKATVTSTSTGWTAVVTLPLSGLTTASTPKFDVAVTNGGQTDDWNTPGSLGTLQLVEPLSFTTIPEASAAPTIDGTKDAVWSEASQVTTNKKISGADDGAKATVSQLWKDDYLYVLADVTDPTIDTSSGNAYEQDSVEIFTDLGNAKNGSYRADDAQMRISADNAVSFGAGDSEDAQKARLTSATSRTSTGYIVEARIDLKDTTGVGKFEGLDYEVNDGTAGVRTANFGWAEQTGSAYQTTSRWGVAELEGPAAPPTTAPAVTTQPKSVSGAPGSTVKFTAAASGNPAPTVAWQRESKGSTKWTAISGATAATLSVKVDGSVDGAKYRAVFTNSAGSATTSAATLTVTHVKPKVTTQPKSAKVHVGTVVRFTAAATGYPTPTITWQRELKGQKAFSNLNAHGTSLSVTGWVGGNGSKYRAVFTNAAGSVTSSTATLTVLSAAPKVTTQPKTVTTHAGTVVRFTAKATGDPTPTITWQRLLAGQRSWQSLNAHGTSLTVTAWAGGNGSKYRVVFTNAAGHATSSVATLIVVPARASLR